MTKRYNADNSQSKTPPYFENEWYEDAIDLNLKAFAMREDEWVERESQQHQLNARSK